MDLQSLVNTLTPAGKWPERVDSSTTPFLDLNTEEPPHYVVPELVSVQNPSDAHVLLIEAAGAVGKSVAAQYLSSRLRWPLVHTNRAQVGHYSLSGLIQDALGPGSDFFVSLAGGHAGLVIDALDEAHLRAGTQNLFAFLDNVASLAKSVAVEGIKIVLLSRIDTAEFVKLKFEDAGQPLAVASLSFFSQEATESYVTHYLARRAEETNDPIYRVPQANPQPFGRLLNYRIRQLASSLLHNTNADYRAKWHDLKEFLGYAPVLAALAESLAVTNPGSEIGQLHGVDYQDETELLVDIVKRIAEREQGKVVDQLGSQLYASIPAGVEAELNVAALYSQPEQVARLAEFIVGGDGLGVEMPASLPLQLREPYENAIRQFLPDHPFLRGRAFASPVFADFVQAARDCDPTVEVSLPQVAEIPVGPFYRRFAGVMAAGAVKERSVQKLLNSWGQETQLYDGRDHAVFLGLRGEEGNLEFLVPTATGKNDTVHFRVVDCSGALTLSALPKGLTVTTSEGVVLADQEGRFSLPSGVLVAASEIDFTGEVLQVDAYGQDAFALLLASDTFQANRIRAIEGGTHGFRVAAPSVPPILRPHAIAVEQYVGQPVSFGDAISDFVHLRAILLKFYSTVHLGLSCSQERMSHDVVRDNRDRDRILGFLVSEGVIAPEGSWWTLSPNALPFGAAEVKAGHPSRNVVEFLMRARSA